MKAIQTGKRQPASSSLLILVIAVTIFFAYTSNQMLAPLLVELAQQFHTNVGYVGQLMAATSVTWATTAFLVGPLSDRYGRKRLMLLGLGVMGVGSFICAAAQGYWLFLAGRLTLGLGGGALATTQLASTGDYFPPEERGRALGWIMTAFPIALVAGVPAAAILAEWGGWRAPFLVAGILLFVFLWWNAITLPDDAAMGAGQATRYLQRYRDILGNASAKALLSANSLERLTFSTVMIYIPAFLMERYGINLAQLAPLLSIIALGGLTGTLIGGRLTDRTSKTGLFAVCQSTAALLTLPLWSFSPSIAFSTTMGGLFSAFNGGSRPAVVWMGTETSQASRGTMMGLTAMSNQMGQMLGSALGGLFLILAGYPSLSILSATGGLLAAAICWLFVKQFAAQRSPST